MFDVLVGINLLREGLDLPEVSLVGILDADKEGYLRSERSLIQTIGRARATCAGTRRHVRRRRDRLDAEGDRRDERGGAPCRRCTTASTASRRRRSAKAIADALVVACEADYVDLEAAADGGRGPLDSVAPRRACEALRDEMRAAAKALEFERAAALRDEIRTLEQQAVGLRADA